MPTTYRYQAYLLRLWREGEDGPWRASVEDPHDGSQRRFASLTQLLAFLEEETGERWSPPEGKPLDRSLIVYLICLEGIHVIGASGLDFASRLLL